MEKHNYWTVKDKSRACRANGYKWLCRCICGAEKLVRKKYLINGKSKSCGCSGIYVGLKVGQYTIKKIDGVVKTVQCNCGHIMNVRFERGKPRR